MTILVQKNVAKIKYIIYTSCVWQ